MFTEKDWLHLADALETQYAQYAWVERHGVRTTLERAEIAALQLKVAQLREADAKRAKLDDVKG